MKRKRVLILEDDPRRIHQFRDVLEGTDLEVYIDAFSAARHYGTQGKYDLLLLDHDLGGLTYVDTTKKNTGSEFCRWLTQNVDIDALPRTIIHSYNPVGALEMRKLIPSAEYIPMGDLLLMTLREWNT